MYQAKDVMTRDVLTLRANATVREAIRMMLDYQISGLPVVDSTGRLLGVVSELELLEIVYAPEFQDVPVAKIMTRNLITVTEGTLVSDVAALFTENKFRRVPVVRDDQLVGLISRRDVLRYATQSTDDVAAAVTAVRGLIH